MNGVAGQHSNIIVKLDLLFIVSKYSYISIIHYPFTITSLYKREYYDAIQQTYYYYFNIIADQLRNGRVR